MATIAFFLNLGRFKEILSNAHLEYGNPGIGGTPYLFLLTVKYLNRLYGKDYSIMLSDSDFGLNDPDVKNHSVNNEMGALEYCHGNNIKTLVINANMADRVPPDFYKTNIRIVLWAHNTVTSRIARIAAMQDSVYTIVCVSRQQYMNMKDTECFNKCTYITNVLPPKFVEPVVLSNYSERKAVYVGSIMPQKGAHNLLKIWKYVEKKIPEAELYIFGGVNIWNPSQKKGCLGIGDYFYDKVLYKELYRLKNPNNVHFMGAKSWREIEQYVKTFRVGVVNPSHYLRDETFCMSAAELAAHGIPVVSRDRNDGLLSTVLHGKTGFLEKKDKEIANRIVEFLCNDNKCKDFGENSISYSKSFVIENEIHKWKDLVDDEYVISSCKTKRQLFSKDALCLWHDKLLKVAYTVISGKAFYLLKKMMRIKEL